MSTPGKSALTQQRSRRIQAPPAGYIITTARGHQLLVRRPDGRPTRVRPSERFAATDRVESTHAYLHIPAA
jgi:hypothetical protein